MPIYNLLIREEYIDFRFPAALWTFREDWTISTINDHYMAPRSSSENKTCVVATCVSNSFQLSCSGLSLCKNYPRINCYSVRDKTNENFFSFVSSHPPHNSTKVFSNLQQRSVYLLPLEQNASNDSGQMPETAGGTRVHLAPKTINHDS